MTKVIFFLSLMTCNLSVLAHSDPYSEAMKAGLDMLENASGADALLAAANHFSRIADMEKERWHPAYYTALSYAMMASGQGDPSKLDPLLDASEQYLDRVEKLDHDRSELLVLRGFVHMLRIGADPQSRGQMYSGMSAAALQQAQKLNKNNPRAIHFLAQLSFGTAQFFGTDSSEACALNDRSIEIFAAVADAPATDAHAPTWGLSMAESFKSRCVN